MIEPMGEHSRIIPTLVEWYESEWAPYYGADGPGDALTDLTSRCNLDRIPMGLVAMENGDVLGTVALDLDPATDLTPSIVGLLVSPEHRRKGIAADLIESATDSARRLGYRRVYMSTSLLGDLLRRLGWRELGRVEFLDAEQGSVYERALDDS